MHLHGLAHAGRILGSGKVHCLRRVTILMCLEKQPVTICQHKTPSVALLNLAVYTRLFARPFSSQKVP